MAEGRRVVVTGAAGGIGRAIVRVFSEAGWQVVATDIEPAPVDLPCSLYVQADLARTASDESYAGKIFERIDAHLNGAALHALVNNAAVQILGGAHNLRRADWRQSLDVNLVAPFIWTQALLPALEKAQGAVVNISSIHARLTKRDFVAYATTKAALSGMTRALAVDLRGRVRVNAIEPAAIATDMLKAGFEDRDTQFAQLQAVHPAGRIGTPGEVAAAVLWLAAAAPAFLQGACIALDGAIGGCLLDPA